MTATAENVRPNRELLTAPGRVDLDCNPATGMPRRGESEGTMSVATVQAKPRPPAYATIREGSQYTRLCERSLRRAIEEKKLRAYRFGSRVLVRYRDLDRLLEGETSNT